MQKLCKKICKIFAEFLQLHILQKVLHFRPREESVRGLGERRINARNLRKCIINYDLVFPPAILGRTNWALGKLKSAIIQGE